MTVSDSPPTYGAREIRANLREALNHVLRGTHVRITRHGMPEAYIVPADWYEAHARKDTTNTPPDA